jgi:PST family polysaccharide transporter
MNRPWLRYVPAALQRRLHGRHNLQGIISNSGWLLADTFFRMLVGLVLGTLIARYLGPGLYGSLRYATAFVALFSMFAALGLDGVVVRELSVHPEQKGAILGSAFVVKLVGGLIACGMVLATIAVSASSRPGTVLLVAILAPGLIFLSFDTAAFWFQSQLQARRIAFARGSAFAAVSVLKVWLLLTHASLVAFAWASVLETALASTFVAVAFRLSGNSISTLRFDRAMARNLMRNSWPLAVSGTFVVLTMQLDKVLLGELAGDVQVGIYSVAYQLSSIWYTIPMILGMSIAPSLFRSHAGGDPSYAASLQKVYTTLTYIAVATAIVLSFLADDIIALLFGTRFQGAGQVLAIHIWGAVFVFHVSVRSRALLAEGRQKFVTAMAALTLLVNVLLNLMLIKAYGAQGAAWASLISWALCATVFPVLWAETRPSARMFLSSFKVRYR